MSESTGLATLFETMRVFRGTLPLLERHVARLSASCRALDLLAPPADLAEDAASHGLRPPADRVVRISWDGASMIWDDRDLPASDPVHVAVVSQVHLGYPHKTTQRVKFDRAMEQAREYGAEEPLLLTVGGRVAEAARFAVAWIDDGMLRMPELALEILPSIGRERLMAVAEEQGIAVEPGRYPREALAGRPILLVNAARGVVPVASLDGVTVPADPTIDALAAAFWPSA